MSRRTRVKVTAEAEADERSVMGEGVEFVRASGSCCADPFSSLHAIRRSPIGLDAETLSIGDPRVDGHPFDDKKRSFENRDASYILSTTRAPGDVRNTLLLDPLTNIAARRYRSASPNVRSSLETC